MKYFCSRLSIVIPLLIALSLSGCASLRPVSSGPLYSSSPEQSAAPVIESPAESRAKGPIDELALPGYDVKTSILWDLNGDGTKETISAGQGGAQETGYDILLSVSDNGGFNTITVGSGYFEKADYLVTTGGTPGVVLSISYEDDYSSTFVVSFDGLKPVLHGSVDGIAEEISGSKWIAVNTFIDVLGTWPCVRSYEITDDFSLKPSGDYYIKSADLDPLVTKRKLSVEVWKDGDFMKVTLNAGTSLIPYSTDGKTCFGFGLKDYFGPGESAEGRLFFTISEGECFIGGINENDCFEYVPYAG